MTEPAYGREGAPRFDPAERERACTLLGANVFANDIRCTAGGRFVHVANDRGRGVLRVLDPGASAPRELDAASLADKGLPKIDVTLDVHPTAERALILVHDEVGTLVEEIDLVTFEARPLLVRKMARRVAFAAGDHFAVLAPEGLELYRKTEAMACLCARVKAKGSRVASVRGGRLLAVGDKAWSFFAVDEDGGLRALKGKLAPDKGDLGHLFDQGEDVIEEGWASATRIVNVDLGEPKPLKLDKWHAALATARKQEGFGLAPIAPGELPPQADPRVVRQGGALVLEHGGRGVILDRESKRSPHELIAAARGDRVLVAAPLSKVYLALGDSVREEPTGHLGAEAIAWLDDERYVLASRGELVHRKLGEKPPTGTELSPSFVSAVCTSGVLFTSAVLDGEKHPDLKVPCARLSARPLANLADVRTWYLPGLDWRLSLREGRLFACSGHAAYELAGIDALARWLASRA
ncbi:MAG: hypothetical protein K8H88_07110 [Sandaracinaceae bacterium]|nr:hypothetical protein [Sandaracinaceae bacterium]